MILLKGFIRYKSTKIYLIIFTALLIAIAILFNFINYYSNIVTKTYQENSYFLIISDKDNYNKIKEKDYVVNLENVILLEPDYENNFLDSHNITWNNLFDHNNNFIVAIPNINNEIKLTNNQIALTFPKIILENFDNIYNLEKQNAFFINDDNRITFELKKITESHFSRVLISNETFQRLLKERSLYGCIFLINDYEQKNYIIDSLNKIDSVQKVIFNQTYTSEVSFYTIENLKNIISILNFVSKIIVSVFLILFLIVTKNIVSDELDNMRLEKLLGYNKHQIKKFLIIKMMVLNLCIFICSTIGYIFINFLIINFLSVKINLFDSFVLLNIYIIILLVSLFFGLFSKVKTNQKSLTD